MKNKLFILAILFPLLINAIKFSEKEPYDYPVFENPTEEEKNGIALKIDFLENYTVYLNQRSKYFDKLFFNKETKQIDGKQNDFSDFFDGEISYYKTTLNDKGDYKLERCNYSKYGEVYFDKNNKILKINRNAEYWNPREVYRYLLDNAKYYIPDKIIKINDQWESDFNDESIYQETGDKKNKQYLKEELNAGFKLIGYAYYNDKRCALIESDINFKNKFFLFYKQSIFKQSGGTMCYEIKIKNLIYLDYKINKVVYAKSFFIQKAKGNLLKNWGNTSGEAVSNVQKGYNGYINKNGSFIKQMFYNYFHGSENEFQNFIKSKKIKK